MRLNTLQSGLEGNWLLLLNILRVIKGDRTEITDAKEQINLLKKWGFVNVLKTLGVSWKEEDGDSEDDESRLMLSDVMSSHVAPLVSSHKTDNGDDNKDAGIKRTTSSSEFKRKKVNNYFSVRK
ncbi:hypothetical protein RCL1_000391 [Eukaryota sp. TZLM3-RCL]